MLNAVRCSVIALAGAALSGCVGAPKVPRPDPAFIAMQRAAEEIQASWAMIGAVDVAMAQDAGAYVAPASVALSPKMSQTITLRWSGDHEPILELLTGQAGIPLKVTGKRPAHPIPPVFVEVHDARVGDVIRDVGYQLSGQVSIVVTAVEGQESVEIVYARAGQ